LCRVFVDPDPVDRLLNQGLDHLIATNGDSRHLALNYNVLSGGNWAGGVAVPGASISGGPSALVFNN
jgi:hypothetical protein